MAIYWYPLFILVAYTVYTVQSGTISCTENKDCNLHCNEYMECAGSDTILQCKPNYPCTISCTDSKACNEAKIYANDASSLSVQCSGFMSCYRTSVYCDNTNNCDIICNDNWWSTTCDTMTVDCATSMCSIDCDTTKTCEISSINTDDAMSFKCNNNCADTVPKSFIRTTVEPVQTTAITSTTNKPSVSSTKTSSTTTTTTHYQSTTEFVTVNTGSISSTEAASTAIISSDHQISSTALILSSIESIESTTTATDDGIMVIITEPEQEQEVAVKTTHSSDIESVDHRTNNIINVLGIDHIWIYIATIIGGGVLCCVLIGLMYTVGRRRKCAKDTTKPEVHKVHVNIPNPVHKAIPSTTATPVSYYSHSVSPVALTPATMTPVTPVKIRNLSIIKDNAQYTNSFPDTLNNRFSVYLADLDIDDIDNVEIEIVDDEGIEMNSMNEGNIYVNDNDDDILDIVNETAKTMGETGNDINDGMHDDIDVDQIVINEENNAYETPTAR